MNIELVFYKGSFGLKLDKKIYRFRRNLPIMQELDFIDNGDCEIIDTGYPVSMVAKEDIEKLLKQKARQLRTLYTRYNCLRSHRHILDKLPGYETKGKILPQTYRKGLK